MVGCSFAQILVRCFILHNSIFSTDVLIHFFPHLYWLSHCSIFMFVVNVCLPKEYMYCTSSLGDNIKKMDMTFLITLILYQKKKCIRFRDLPIICCLFDILIVCKICTKFCHKPWLNNETVRLVFEVWYDCELCLPFRTNCSVVRVSCEIY
jgi:hypothetical protein